MTRLSIIILIALIPFLFAQTPKPAKCGFGHIIKNPLLSKLHGKKLAQANYVTPEGNFIIYYDTTGRDAIGMEDRNQNNIPDRVEIVGYYAEKDRRLIVDTLGFKAPLNAMGQPLDIYEIYLVNLGSGLYGQTWFVDEIQALPGNNYTSYIEINTSFAFASHLDPDPFKRDSLGYAVTISHEFFHSIQLCYHIRLDSGMDDDLWFIEASATTFEEWNVPGGDDYFEYLPEMYKYTELPVYQQAGNRIYGEVVLNFVMESMMGRSFMKSAWDKILSKNAVLAISDVLGANGLNWQKILAETGAWLVRAGKSGEYPLFDDIKSWPHFDISQYGMTASLQDSTVHHQTLNPYSFNVILNTGLTETGYKIEFDLGESVEAIAMDQEGNVFRKFGNRIAVQDISGDALYLTNAAGQGQGDVQFNVTFLPYSVNENFTGQYYPNPLNFSEHFFLYLTTSTEPIEEVRIISSTGKAVYSKTFIHGESTAVIPISELNDIKTGVYFLEIKTDKIYFDKLLIIR